MSIPFYNDIDLNNNIITNSGAPTNPNDLANKDYVDVSIENLTSNLNTQFTTLNDTLTTYIDSNIEELNTNITTQIQEIENNYIPEQIAQSIVDNLVTQESTKALSANQGYILSTLISNIPLNTYHNTINRIGTWDEYDLNRIKVEKVISNPTQFYTIQFTELDLTSYEVVNIKGYYTIENSRKWLCDYNVVNSPLDEIDNIKYGIYIYDYDLSTNTLYLYIGTDTLNTLTNQTITFIIEFVNKITE